MEIQVLEIVNAIATPAAGVIGWFAGRKKQNNDFLRDLQASIDLLAEKNRILMEEVVKLREENAKLRGEVEELSRKLENVKTITCKS
jgi:FtsZ-binding cell division protein ZapB